MTSFLHIVLILTLIKPKHVLKTNSAEICTTIITASWALNMACSIAKTVANLIEKVKKFREKSRIKSSTQIDINSRKDHHDLDKNNEIICVEDLESKITILEK